MTKFTVFGATTAHEAETGARFNGRLTFVFALATPVTMLGVIMLGVLVLGAADARAGVKARFADPDPASNPSVQVVALESQNRLVGAEDLSDERAKGFTPGTLSAPGDDSKVAVILWDDAWSELQRRARSATAAAAAGSNAGTSIAGSSGAGSN